MRKITSLTFNYNGNIVFADNSSHVFAVVYDGVHDGEQFQKLIGKSFDDLKEFIKAWIPDIKSLTAAQSKKVVSSFALNLYGNVSFDDGTVDGFSFEYHPDHGLIEHM